MFILLTNDDGIDSPALAPFARALQGLGRVEVVVPDRERSWIGKAITRHDVVSVERTERNGVPMYTATGYPADCTQLGVHSLFDERPDVVVSGINVGYNHGTAFMLSSGTVGAAVEGWISSLPAFAVSAGTTGDWPTWSRWVWSDQSAPMWERLAGIAGSIISDVLDAGFPDQADVISLNLPGDADEHTPRRVTTLARIGYDRLFAPSDGGGYRHEFGGGFRQFEGLEGTDIEAAADGAVAITPIRLPGSGDMPSVLRTRLAGTTEAAPGVSP